MAVSHLSELVQILDKAGLNFVLQLWVAEWMQNYMEALQC
jgi:hypothetical protein